MGLLFLHVKRLSVRPRLCRTDFVQTAIAPDSLDEPLRGFIVFRTFLIQEQNRSPCDSRIPIIYDNNNRRIYPI